MAKKEEAPKSLFRRLTRLFRSGPVIKKKIRTVDTTMAVADKTKSSGTLLFQKSLAPTYATITANAYNLSERLMRYQDFQEMEYCVSFQTLVATTDGYVQIGELAERCSKDPDHTFIVYSYDHEKKQIVPAFAKQARQTRVAESWKIKFDSGKEIIASDNHRLMLRDGTYREVRDLKIGDAMMPFYRKDLFEGAEEGTKGYSWIYTMNDKFRGWTKEHQLIAEWIAGRPLTEDECVHHINFVKSDNRPENLKIMTNSDHNSYHAAINNGVKWAPENHEWIEQFKKNHATWMRDNAPTQRRDVTFGRILELSESLDFDFISVCRALDVDRNVVYSRLADYGFSTYESFIQAYRQGATTLENKRTKSVREISLDDIKTLVTKDDTKQTLCIKLGCTVNVFNKFLDRKLSISWTQFRQNMGWSIDNINCGRPKGSNKGTLTFQQICDAYETGLTLPRLTEKLGVNKNTIISRLAQNGYQKYSEFQTSYCNHKVVSIEYVGEIPLYDLTVDGYKNFATDSVISHNTPEIAAALDIYADETVAADEKGRCLHIYSDNEKVKEILEDLFYNTLNVEFNLRSWARNLVKYGDFFLYNDVSQHYGVVSAFPIPVNEIEREENYDRDDPFAVRYRWVTLGNRVLENWEVTHFRLLGNDMFLPYGSSIIEPARRIWRQLILIEDAMLVYRVVRAPERRVFYIDVANIPAADIPVYMEEQRKNLRSNQVVDRTSGRVDLRYNPLSVDEDYFIPVRGTESGTKIDTLAGGQNTAAVEDVAYIQKKLFAALKIPRAYLGYDEMLSCLTGDTRVPLLNGVMTMAELAALDWTQEQDIWVYSAEQATGAFRPGRVKRAWATKEVDELYEVRTDDGGVVRCTGNHPFLCRDGSYKRADELAPGQSLMPVYKKLSSKSEGDFQDGYEKILDNATQKWKYTHRVIADCYDIKDDESRSSERSYVIHHVDHNKKNNTPSNLVKMGKTAHAKHHSNGAIANLLTLESRNKLRQVMSTQDYKVVHQKGVQSAWDKDSGTRSATVAMNNTKYKRKDINLDVARTIAMSCENRKQFYNRIGLSYTGFAKTCIRQGVHHGAWLTNIFGNKKTKVQRNHKVVSVEVIKLATPIAVYDLEVDTWHNFAVQTSDDNKFIVVHNSKATLAQEDIRFSRTISVIQKVMISELNKLAIIHLYAHGFDQDDLQNFTLRLSNPSTIAQQQKLELWRTKFEIGGSAPEGYVNKDFVRKEIWGLNDDECKQIDKSRLKDKIVDGTIESASAPGEGGDDLGGGDDLFGDAGGGGGGGDESADAEAPADDLPPEENAGEEPEEEVEPGAELLTSADKPDDDEHFGLKLSDKDMEVPLKAQRQLDRVLYNRDRRRTHGASKTHMPDFRKMTSNDNHAMEDPYDNDWIKSVVSNPFGESRTSYKTNITSDVASMLNNWSKRNVTTPSVNTSLLSEDANNSKIDDDEDVLIIDDDGADDE